MAGGVEEARRRVEDKFYRVSVIERLLAFKGLLITLVQSCSAYHCTS